MGAGPPGVTGVPMTGGVRTWPPCEWQQQPLGPGDTARSRRGNMRRARAVAVPSARRHGAAAARRPASMAQERRRGAQGRDCPINCCKGLAARPAERCHVNSLKNPFLNEPAGNSDEPVSATSRARNQLPEPARARSGPSAAPWRSPSNGFLKLEGCGAAQGSQAGPLWCLEWEIAVRIAKQRENGRADYWGPCCACHAATPRRLMQGACG